MYNLFVFSYKTSTSGRSLIRSHFGPMIHNSGMSEISLYLPNNIIYAMGLENLTMGTVQVLAKNLYNLGSFDFTITFDCFVLTFIFRFS